MANISQAERHSISNIHNPHFIFNENLDADFLSDTYGNNLSFGAKMFGLFLRTIPSDLQELSRAVKDLDYPMVQAVAHKIKNNFTWVGLSKLSKVTHDLEDLARAKSDKIIGLVEELLKENALALQHIEQQYSDLNTQVGE